MAITVYGGNVTVVSPQKIPRNFTLRQELVPSDLAVSDQFGYSGSLDEIGSLALVSSRNRGSERGVAYFFDRINFNTWAELQQIDSDHITGERFGHTVSLSGDGTTALVGVSRDADSAPNAGSMIIYTETNGVWSEQQKLFSSDIQDGDNFGSSVAISTDGNTCIGGANGEDVPGSASGAAYIFVKDSASPGGWTEQQKIEGSDIASGDDFGLRVAISGDGNVAVGAAKDHNSATGAVYVFVRTGTTWSEAQKLVASDGTTGDIFGDALDISPDGNVIVVGARVAESGGESGAGAAYVFTRNTGSPATWTQAQRLSAPIPQASGSFGVSVSASGNGEFLVIGSHAEDSLGSPNVNTGAVYIFKRGSGSPEYEFYQKMVSDNLTSSALFGFSVDISVDGRTILIGALLQGGTGSTYIYKRP